MKKALVLLAGATIYVLFLHWERDVALSQLSHVQNLYTSANVEALAISSSNR
jgi:hypothetical protein